MSKTTFLGYVPSLKLKGAKATIVEGKAIESKGGSIRYTLRGEYKGRKTLPKTVTKADFEGIYGFDAKEAEAVYIKGNQDHNGVKNPQAIYHQVGKEDEEGFETTEIIPIENKEDASRVISREMHKDGRIIHNVLPKSADTVGSPSPASVEPPAPSEKPFPQEPTNENFSAEEKSMECPHCNEEIWNIDVKATCELCGGTLEEWIDYPSLVVGETEVKESFLGFGDDEEEEEEDEKPTEQEFTVIMQPGDKLEMTDIVEDVKGNGDNSEETEEKEAECKCDNVGYINNDWLCLDCGDKVEQPQEYEAVQTKITRPVKEEDEDEEADEDKSLLTPLNVGIGLAVAGVTAAAVLAAEEDEEDEESDYWAGEREYVLGAEGYEPYEFKEADGDGQIDHDTIDTYEDTEVHFRHDYPTTMYNWETDPKDQKLPTGIDEHDIGSEVEDAITEEIGDEPSEGDDHIRMDITEDVVVDVDYDTDYGEKRFYGLAAEGEDFQKMTSSEFVPFDQITAEIQEEWDETTPSISADYEPINEPSNANFSAETSTKQGWEITHYGGKHDTRIAKKDGLSVYIEKLSKNSIQHKREGANWKVTYGRYVDDGSGGVIIPLAELFRTYNDIFTWLNNPPFTIHNHAETVGSPSPTFNEGITGQDGPSAEPTNANFSAEDNIKRFKVGERYTHRYHHGYHFRDNEIMRRTDKTVWTSQVNPETGKVDNPLLVSRHTIHTTQPWELDGKIVWGEESYGLGNHGYRVKAGQTTMRKYADTVGSPSPSGPSSVPEPAEATGSEPSNEHMNADSKNNLGLLAGVGLIAASALLLGQSDKILALFDRFKK